MNIPQWQTSSHFQTLMVPKKDLPMIKFVILFPFGADRDPFDKQGLTNLVGDLLLRGCKTMNRTELEDKLDELGASLNIFTGFHSVSIEGRVLKRNFHELLQIMEQVLSTPTFPEKELSDLKAENIAHLRLRLDDDQSLAKLGFNEIAYKDHLYAREITGTQQTLSNIKNEDIKNHFQNFFTQNGVMVGLSGDVSQELVNQTTQVISNSLPNTVLSLLDASSQAIPKKGKTLVFVDKPARTQTHFYIGHPTLPLHDANAFDFLAFKTAFSGGLFQAKYMHEIRVKRGWSYGAYGSTDHRQLSSMYYLYTFPKNEDTADAISVSLDLYKQAQDGRLLTDADYEFAKNYLYRSFPFKIDTPAKILSQKIFHKLLELPENYIETYRHHVESVSPEGITDRIQKYFMDDNLVIAVLGSKDEILSQIQEKVQPTHTKVIDYKTLV